MTDQQELALCQAGIQAWQDAFNRQNAAGCAAQYASTCTMQARPVGMFTGADDIRAFWQDIIDQGFSDVVYFDVVWEKHPKTGYLLSANWTMNKAFGKIHAEHWVVEQDGRARLQSDDFEILGER
ncbi:MULTISPECIES: nuclear transport factor 2 family protein [unclassified Pseudoalteromonas]|uniref:nuclear transport factor 2 family protein n=1 Tax=unclassified Pseudoalteromonas TaxID=194690 RepID=UPI002097D070|nr:nuclear transport factor 2 family protein [Pseudoalteromonas sp. XMcav2-N]MCO7187913.1 nuclear transport factor 2 family protein [Pseudoalteromonas sp. XMcav2-N]